MHKETWDRCKHREREKRASRSAKSELCRCGLVPERTSEDGWCTVRSRVSPQSVVEVAQENYRNMLTDNHTAVTGDDSLMHLWDGSYTPLKTGWRLGMLLLTTWKLQSHQEFATS